MDITAFSSLPLLGILRGIQECDVEPIADICKKTGLQAIEITMNTPNAKELIKQMKYYSRGKFAVGAGTVVNYKDLDNAVAAGAQFIVMPSVQTEIIRICVSQNIPVFPGAFTPTEIYTAWNLGATMVKVFPSSVLGPKYFKEIKGPFDAIKLLACGGISVTSIGDFFAAGADAAAFGASVFVPHLLQQKQYDKVQSSVQELVDAYKVLV